MAVPFHRLRVCGEILVAARGASVHTFSLAQGLHIAAWKLAKQENKGDVNIQKENPAQEADENEEDVPPSKRRRLDGPTSEEPTAGSEEKEAKNENEEENEDQNGTPKEHQQNGGSSRKKKKKSKPKADSASNKIPALRSADLPVISLLEATEDGRHVVVVMGHDKTVRVLEHDMKGNLRQISERVMPKRPCALAITADGQTILSGDKFGDVYGLPLIETERPKEAEKEEAAPEGEAASPRAASAIPAPLRLEANRFTVHTKGNRQALENQRRQKERLLQGQLHPEQQRRKEQPDSADYHLLLGHVSMLTAVAVAEAVPLESRGQKALPTGRRPPRPLILTADRDEHIRVTRGVIGGSPATSQTHVIETFCLGHAAFVSRLCVPQGRPDRLVSGGGDPELRLWDFWPEGRLVGTVPLASLVGDVMGSASSAPKVAVSGLYTFAGPAGAAGADPDAMTDGSDAEAASFLVAICERVPALFFFELVADGNALVHRQTLRLPGGQLPLDLVEVALAGGDGRGVQRLIVSVTTADEATGAAREQGDIAGAPKAVGRPLLALERVGNAAWSISDADAVQVPPLPADDPTTSLDPAALRQLLQQSTESLRKGGEEGGEDKGE